MLISKEMILSALKAKESDKGLSPFYEHLGPSIRREYVLDALPIVDLDWEAYGLVITLSEGKLEQIRLDLKEGDKRDHKVWMGDGIESTLTVASLSEQWGLNETFTYKKEGYTIAFEFSNSGHLEALIYGR